MYTNRHNQVGRDRRWRLPDGLISRPDWGAIAPLSCPKIYECTHRNTCRKIRSKWSARPPTARSRSGSGRRPRRRTAAPWRTGPPSLWTAWSREPSEIRHWWCRWPATSRDCPRFFQWAWLLMSRPGPRKILSCKTKIDTSQMFYGLRWNVDLTTVSIRSISKHRSEESC